MITRGLGLNPATITELLVSFKTGLPIKTIKIKIYTSLWACLAKKNLEQSKVHLMCPGPLGLTEKGTKCCIENVIIATQKNSLIDQAIA